MHDQKKTIYLDQTISWYGDQLDWWIGHLFIFILESKETNDKINKKYEWCDQQN